MEIELDSVHDREKYLTVVRGCLGTVIAHWDRLDDDMRQMLLQTAMDKVEELVRNLERDVRPLTLNGLVPSDAGREPRATVTLS